MKITVQQVTVNLVARQDIQTNLGHDTTHIKMFEIAGTNIRTGKLLLNGTYISNRATTSSAGTKESISG